MANEVFKGTAKLSKGMKVECTARDHKIIMDEPKELGGTDEGMNPIEALLCALGGCKCIVASCYARAKRIDLQEIWIEVEGVLDPDGFMGKNKDVKVGLQSITSKIHIKSSSPKEDIEKFVEFIDRTCPVADTLEKSPELITEIIYE
ncbi:OsmC family protein [Anaerosalibacter sp. Marseille-P3206]|uniref:OsmC family protein n=1 Tax=Anaerosalibacter sp. Marseille-P3206 TaxID=1871005 RepID=UPI000986525C|nr:OsmC family protein [Anaerosalibacter sp. Marseille-P3206]